jgi:hypothetical protein
LYQGAWEEDANVAVDVEDIFSGVGEVISCDFADLVGVFTEGFSLDWSGGSGEGASDWSEGVPRPDFVSDWIHLLKPSWRGDGWDLGAFSIYFGEASWADTPIVLEDVCFWAFELQFGVRKLGFPDCRICFIEFLEDDLWLVYLSLTGRSLIDHGGGGQYLRLDYEAAGNQQPEGFSWQHHTILLYLVVITIIVNSQVIIVIHWRSALIFSHFQIGTEEK